jgi:hypothetical protein
MIIYSGFGLSVPVTVSKLIPQFDVPADLTARYGDSLSSIALPDRFSFAGVGSVGAVGDNEFTLTFTPDDLVNYEIATVTVTVSVSKAAAFVITDELLDGVEPSDATDTSVTMVKPGFGFEQELEYAISPDGQAPADGWQSDLVFSGLAPDTVYYIFARPKADERFEEGEAVIIEEIRTGLAGAFKPKLSEKSGMPLGILMAVIFASVGVLAICGLAIYFFGIKKRSIKDFLIGETDAGDAMSDTVEAEMPETVSAINDPFAEIEEKPAKIR